MRGRVPGLGSLALFLVFGSLADGARGVPLTLVPLGSVWRYLDDGSDPGTSWRLPGFDAGSWREGPAELGYGDTQVTLIDYGGDPQDKHMAYYFRHTFQVSGEGALGPLELQLLRDDGAVVYLNGDEVVRSNLPPGPIDYLTPAANAGASENDLIAYDLPAGLLADGVNTLAVEIHQRSPTSSDVSFDLSLALAETPVSLLRGPYLQLATSSSVVVRWRTDVAAPSLVRYGSDPSALTGSAGDVGLRTEHEVALTGLSAASEVHFRVGTTIEGVEELLLSGVSSFTVPPAPGTVRSTRVWVLGDSGTASASAREVRDAYRAFAAGRPHDLWLMLGDNAYPDGTDGDYQAAVFEMYAPELRTSVLWPTLGNHDGISADSATQTGAYYDIFTLPANGEAGGLPSGTEAYYSFDYANIHFVVLDSHDSDLSPDGAMLSWLTDDLLVSTADWLIAFWHHPPYTKGSHDSDSPTDSGGRLGEVRRNVLPILEAAGVDLVLSGHSHSYERSVLLDHHYGHSSTLEPWMVLDGGDGRPGGAGPYIKPAAGFAPNAGAVYVVAGSAGKVSSGSLDHPAMFVSLSELGSLALDIDGSVLSGRFVRFDGAVGDAFTLVRGSNPLLFSDGFESGDARRWSETLP